MIPNKDYAPETYAKYKDLTTVGFELWTVNGGSIFDNILVTDDKKYADKMAVYKIDTDAEQELAAVFGIQSIPSMLFIPVDDKPQMAVGALPKDSIKQAMKDVLSVE